MNRIWSFWQLGLTLAVLFTACTAPESIAEPISPPAPTSTVTPAPSITPTATLAAPTVTPLPAPTSTLRPTSTLNPTSLATAAALTPTLTPEVFLPTVMKDWLLAVYETPITLMSYGWEQALVPSNPSAPHYPYPDLNRDLMGPLAPRTYTAVILENSFTRITVLPYLGGRILRWEDRLTGKRLTYENPVIMPVYANWGYRGWWLATGGLEWAFPVDEHGLNEYRPWQYQLLVGDTWRGVRVWDTDDRTGMTIEITLRLYEGESTLLITPRITNPTPTPQPLMFWINAMLTLSGSNAPSSALRFWVPTPQMQVHSAGDGFGLAPRTLINWPIHNNRDFSRYSSWHYYLGVFAAQTTGAMGAYDEVAELGIVRTYPPTIARGVKLFCLGDLPSDIFTHDGSRYFELWGGLNRSFFPEDYLELAPGQTLTWEERWYAIHGMGGLAWANAELAAGFKQTTTGVVIGLYAPRSLEVDLVVKQHNELRGVFPVRVEPATPFRHFVSGSGDGWVLEIWHNGARLVELTPY